MIDYQFIDFIYQNNAYDVHMARRYFDGSSASGGGWYIETGSNNSIALKDSATGATRANISGDTVHGRWRHVCFVRKNKIGYSYMDGNQQMNQYTWTENLDNSNIVSVDCKRSPRHMFT